MHQCLKPNSNEVASKIVDGEAILINLSNGMYYSLDSVGGLIWSLIEAGKSEHSIVDTLVGHFGIAKKTAAQDVRNLIEELTKENLIVSLMDETGSGSREIDATSAPAAYTTPHLIKFDDMTELFALDPPLPELPSLKKQGNVKS